MDDLEMHDVCECGHYRVQHGNGRNRCKICGDSCRRFKLYRRFGR
jgi:hypothetical protein